MISRTTAGLCRSLLSATVILGSWGCDSEDDKKGQVKDDAQAFDTTVETDTPGNVCPSAASFGQGFLDESCAAGQVCPGSVWCSFYGEDVDDLPISQADCTSGPTDVYSPQFSVGPPPP